MRNRRTKGQGRGSRSAGTPVAKRGRAKPPAQAEPPAAAPQVHRPTETGLEQAHPTHARAHAGPAASAVAAQATQHKPREHAAVTPAHPASGTGTSPGQPGGAEKKPWRGSEEQKQHLARLAAKRAAKFAAKRAAKRAFGVHGADAALVDEFAAWLQALTPGTGTADAASASASSSAPLVRIAHERAIVWLHSNFNAAAGKSLARTAMYKHYFLHCRESTFDAVHQDVFGTLVETVFPAIMSEVVGAKSSADNECFITGITTCDGASVLFRPDEQGTAIAAGTTAGFLGFLAPSAGGARAGAAANANANANTAGAAPTTTAKRRRGCEGGGGGGGGSADGTGSAEGPASPRGPSLTKARPCAQLPPNQAGAPSEALAKKPLAKKRPPASGQHHRGPQPGRRAHRHCPQALPRVRQRQCAGGERRQGERRKVEDRVRQEGEQHQDYVRLLPPRLPEPPKRVPLLPPSVCAAARGDGGRRTLGWFPTMLGAARTPWTHRIRVLIFLFAEYVTATPLDYKTSTSARAPAAGACTARQPEALGAPNILQWSSRSCFVTSPRR